MIRLMIFDFDGVIADSAHLALKTINRMAAMEGHSEETTGKELLELGLTGIIKKYKVPLYKVPAYIHKSRDIMNEEIGNVKPHKGVKAALLKLRKGHKLAIISSNSRKNIEVFVRNNGFKGIFDFIVAGVSIFSKSSHMKRALKLAGVEKRYAICVGDEVRDIDAARKAGVRIACVTWGFNSRKLLERNNPDFIVSKPQQLLKVIGKIAKQNP